jgi:hypothetical protein
MWISIAKVLGSHKKLWLPFIAAAFVEVFFIGLVWLAPHPPFSKLLAPPIRYFFSDTVLHYPWHMWFLYYSMKHTHLVASLLAGAFFTGIACVMVMQTYHKKPLSLRNALVEGRVRYLAVAIIWLVAWAAGHFGMELYVRLMPRQYAALWQPIALGILLQWLLVYAIPACVFEGASWWKSLFIGVKESLHYPLSTLSAVAVLTAPLFAFAIYFPEMRITNWVVKENPELSFLFVGLRLLLWLVVDLFLTVAAAHLWLLHRTQGGRGTEAKATARSLKGRIKEGPVVA